MKFPEISREGDHAHGSAVDELRMQARHARQRYDLYKARAYGPRPTSVARMRELERECARAEAGLRFAEGKRAAADAHVATDSSSHTDRADDRKEP